MLTDVKRHDGVTFLGIAFIIAIVAMVVGAYFVTSSVLGRLDAVEHLAARNDCARRIGDEQNSVRATRDNEKAAVIDEIAKGVVDPANRAVYVAAIDRHEQALALAEKAVEALPSFSAEVNRQCPRVE